MSNANSTAKNACPTFKNDDSVNFFNEIKENKKLYYFVIIVVKYFESCF